MKENRLATEDYITDLMKISDYDNDIKKYWLDLLPTILPIMSDDKLRELISLITLGKDLINFNKELLTEYGNN